MATSIEARLARTRRAQGEAADPAASVWVSANAGTGKTHVLTMRVLRLMLAATPPERILCLTYTKAAAAGPPPPRTAPSPPPPHGPPPPRCQSASSPGPPSG